MTTFGQVIDRTRRRLLTTQREPLNVLTATVDADDTAWTFDHSTPFTTGARLSVELEDVYVIAVDAGGTGGTVIRGLDGSTAAAHTEGTIVRVNPSWSNWDIAQAVNDELYDLSSPHNGLFRIKSTDFDYVATQQGYDLSGLTDFQDVWRVRYDTPGPETDWPVLARSDWRVDQAADTTDFASGTSLILKTGGYPGHKVRVSYRATFDPLTGWADDVTTVSGLHAEAHDILSLGAAWRLMAGLASQRALTTAQADPRRTEETQSRDAVIALAPLEDQRNARVMAERARLARKYPQAMG